jgi:hypothetical protein
VALAAGTVYNVVSVAALGMEYFLKYLFAMSSLTESGQRMI